MKEVILTPEGYKKLKQEIEYLSHRQAARGRGADPRSRASSATSPRTPSTTTRRTSRRMLEHAHRDARGAAAERARDHEEGDQDRTWSRSARRSGSGTSTRSKTIEYHIVGSAEANPAENKLSNESPVGKAIMGRKKGETVEVVGAARLAQVQDPGDQGGVSSALESVVRAVHEPARQVVVLAHDEARSACSQQRHRHRATSCSAWLRGERGARAARLLQSRSASTLEATTCATAWRRPSATGDGRRRAGADPPFTPRAEERRCELGAARSR